MLDNRQKYFDDIVKRSPDQMVFYDGWKNRLKNLENNANKMINEGFYTPPYYNEITPFDKGYKGNLQPVGDIPDRDAKRNKYQYNRNKAIEKGYIKIYQWITLALTTNIRLVITLLKTENLILSVRLMTWLLGK